MAEQPPIRVIIADDHTMFREGLCKLLSGEPGFECVGMVSSGEEAISLTQELQPDVAILDASMQNIDGIRAAKEIKKSCPSIAVLILSAYKYPHFVLESLRAGADGYLLKNAPTRELMEAIRIIRKGECVFCIEATTLFRSRIGKNGSVSGHTEGHIHDREMQVLRLVAKGMSNKEISQTLCISVSTVGSHLANIFKKMGVESRTEAVLHAIKEGRLGVDDLG